MACHNARGYFVALKCLVQTYNTISLIQYPERKATALDLFNTFSVFQPQFDNTSGIRSRDEGPVKKVL